MLLKVCGMREPQNIEEVAALAPDFMGFIFFGKSPRDATGILEKSVLEKLPKSSRKIGVFVNAPIEFIDNQIADFQLDGVQLHGSESPEQCRHFREKNLLVLKAFSVDNTFDFATTAAYEGTTDYFLFDTKASGGHGGHGLAFDWQLLAHYQGYTPFLLAGGISPENFAEAAAAVQQHPHGAGLDLNSRFELAPGLKNVAALRKVMQF